MTDENKVEETVSEVKPVERPRGERGELGVATAAKTIKQRYHVAHFKHVDAEDKKNPSRKVWVRNPQAPSLKEFARKLAASGDVNAKDWLGHKNGSMDQKRTEANIALTRVIAAATHAERRKKSAANGKK